MAEETSTIDPALLVEHSGWVRSLAHHLVHDPSGAEDVAQETLLAALSRPPENAGDARRLRAWLGRVTHNLAHLAARGNARRRAREERVARAERLDSAADEVAHDSAMRLVVEEVMGLQEPYRTTVFLRYFEGHTTAEIAELTGTTESAVRKRLWRARGRLRRELDALHDGDRLAWFGALAPLVRPDAATPVTGAVSTATGAASTASHGAFAGGLGVLAVGAAGAALVLGVVGGRAWLAEGSRAPSSSSIDADRSAASLDLSAPTGRVALAPARAAGDASRGATRPSGGHGPRVHIEPVAPPTSSERPGDRADATAVAVRGAVVDLWGNPLGGVRVVAQDAPDEPLATSGADGAFTARVELPVTLTVRAPGYGAVRTARVEPGEAGWAQWLVAAPAVELSGRVLDGEGRPVEGATLEVTFDDEAFIELPILADLRTVRAPSTRTDAEGRFALTGVPTGPGIGLRTAHGSFLEDRRPVPGFSSWGMVIGLERRAVAVRRLAGVVEDEHGMPVAGAEVSLDGRMTRTDERGAFSLEGLSVRDGAPLVATKRGYRATVVPPPSTTWGGDSSRIRLVLGGSPSAISGRLVDGDGRPVEGWQVIAAVQPATNAETSGTPTTPDAPETMGGDPSARSLAPLAFASSGADGAFVLEELGEGSYRVFAYEPDTLLATPAATVRPGADELELVASPGALLAPVHGRVTDRQGRAVAGASVGVVLAPSLPNDGAAMYARASGAQVSTDRDGRFRLPPVPQANVRIRVQHPSVLAAAVAPSPQDPGLDLEIQVERLGRFRASGLDADRFALLDADGSELVVTGPTRSGRRGGLIDGRSAVHAAPASARTLVWYREGEEVGRAEITLSPDGLTELRP